MNDSNALAKLVPGFDFLQGLMQSAGQAVPGMGQWIAPTLDPDEIDKRISELKTVQFWLEQNSRMLSATVQALEVQKMTLGTLQSMNLPMAELQKALTLPTAPTAPAAPAKPAAADKPAPRQESSAKPAVDPMQWWGALTQQFTELAAKAVQDSTAMATRVVAPAAGGAKPAAAAPAASAAKKPAAAKKAARKGP